MSEALQAMERSSGSGRSSLGDLGGLRRARERLRAPRRRARGRIVSADVNGIVVDLDGSQGIVPRHEMELEWLLASPEPGHRFFGYVTAMEGSLVKLSRFGRRERRKRARRRETALESMTARLDEPGERDVVPGLVLTADDQGALVALEEGLITGLVPALALESRPYLTAGRRFHFRVIGRPQEPGRPIDVLLWPQPAAV
jgi:ribosomal protein S1